MAPSRRREPVRVLLRSETEVAREVARGWEAVDVAEEGDQSGGDEEADARDGHEAGDHGDLSGEGRELGLDHLDAPLELADLGQSRANRIWELALGVLDVEPGVGDGVLSADGDRDPELAEKPAQGVDAGGSLGEPAGADAVLGAQCLLGDGLDGDGVDLFVAVGLEHAVRVVAVGLVAADVGLDGVRREQHRRVPKGLHAASPEVSGAASLHNDGGLRELGEEVGELGAGEPPVLRDLARVMRDRHLEDGLCEISRDESIVLHGMDSFCLPDSNDCGTRCRLSRRRGPSHQMKLTRHEHVGASQLNSVLG